MFTDATTAWQSPEQTLRESYYLMKTLYSIQIQPTLSRLENID